MKYVGYIATFIVITFLSVIYSGYALTVLWEWFVVPTFNLPILSIPTAVGLAIIVAYLARDIETSSSKDRSASDAFGEYAFKSFIKPTFALFFGWIALLFV